MINLYNTRIESIALHRIGNKNKGEKLQTSNETIELDDEMHSLLKEYFLKAFRSTKEEYQAFYHEEDIAFHEMNSIIQSMFERTESFVNNSQAIASRLYDQSVHPHIRSGELYVVEFSNCVVDNEKCNAIGIFKSEVKQDFLQFDEGAPNIRMLLQQGVNLNKLDKGAIIFNTPSDGHKILTVDSNRYDAKYWLDDFLGVDVFEDSHFFTRKYLKFCTAFADDVILPAEDKKEQIMFMNRTINHFAKNDDFDESAFLIEVLDNPDLLPEYHHYKSEVGPKYSIEDLTHFPISNTAVNESRKLIKGTINLDTNISIKVGHVNNETADKYLEKGWDEDKQMYYYLVYYNREEKK
ncbi:nucleoid-associated protein [Nonlabens agnitus]|uniref:Nucleoid-associated protein NdpA n=1 Tax=Nonlabens agnitus TaxID=870484 RepID=A0A2S9WXC6_9FLAO|nr:nucleoid-associated protein [Nonlabens agnitus]PRP68130.1 nucleoid-associated protein NdpA [Nonlabens agnitus]